MTLKQFFQAFFSKKAGSSFSLLLGTGLLLVAFQNCSKGFQATGGVDGLDFASLSTAPCSFGSRIIGSGESVEAFSDAKIRHGLSCNDIKEKRTCVGGNLTGSFPHDSCTIDMNTSPVCSFGGQTLGEGQSVIAFAESVVAPGQSCASQTRVCRNGSMTGSYAFNSCQVSTGGECQIFGRRIPNGGTVVGYAKPSVFPGQKCSDSKKLLTCNNGTVAEADSYPHKECWNREITANTRCQIVAPHCPYMPAAEGTWWTEENSAAGLGSLHQKDRETCLSAAALAQSCDPRTPPAVTATFFLDGIPAAKKTQGFYCQIENPTCPYSLPHQGIFRDVDDLATVNREACLNRARYWNQTCGSAKSTATFIQATGTDLIVQDRRSYP